MAILRQIRNGFDDRRPACGPVESLAFASDDSTCSQKLIVRSTGSLTGCKMERTQNDESQEMTGAIYAAAVGGVLAANATLFPDAFGTS